MGRQRVETPARAQRRGRGEPPPRSGLAKIPERLVWSAAARSHQPSEGWSRGRVRARATYRWPHYPHRNQAPRKGGKKRVTGVTGVTLITRREKKQRPQWLGY